MANEAWTVLKLLGWMKKHFTARNVDSPRLAAEVLLAHVLGCQRIELYARHDKEPTEQQRATLRDMVKRAAEHVPVAYLVGKKEFYSLAFKVTADVLIPRPETEGVVGEALAIIERLGRAAKVWDVCTGSGCVAVAIASQSPEAAVLATDICEAALAVAAENARAHAVGDRVRVARADLFTPLPAEGADLAPFDVVTANPPYVAEGDVVGESVKHEPRGALYAGADGLDVIRRLVPMAAGVLARGGGLVMEFGRGQADAVRELIVATGAFTEPEIRRDQAHIERIAVTMKK